MIEGKEEEKKRGKGKKGKKEGRKINEKKKSFPVYNNVPNGQHVLLFIQSIIL